MGNWCFGTGSGAEEMPVEGGTEIKSAEQGSAASTAPASAGFGQESFVGKKKKITVYFILILLKDLVCCFLKMLLYLVA